MPKRKPTLKGKEPVDDDDETEQEESEADLNLGTDLSQIVEDDKVSTTDEALVFNKLTIRSNQISTLYQCLKFHPIQFSADHFGAQTQIGEKTSTTNAPLKHAAFDETILISMSCGFMPRSSTP